MGVAGPVVLTDPENNTKTFSKSRNFALEYLRKNISLRNLELLQDVIGFTVLLVTWSITWYWYTSHNVIYRSTNQCHNEIPATFLNADDIVVIS